MARKNGQLTTATGTVEAPQVTVNTEVNGRDEKGRFATGNRCAVGNPFFRRVAVLRRTFLEAITEDAIKKVADKLIELSLAGDMAAAKVLLSYAVGKPAEAADPDRVDLDELQLLKGFPSAEEAKRSNFKVTPAFAMAIARAMQDVGQENVLITDLLAGSPMCKAAEKELEAAGFAEVIKRAKDRKSKLRDLT